jgi:hypothetical protein
MKSRTYWIVLLVGIIGVGILSRLVHTGWILVDKYLGDALYAAMVYAIIRLFSQMPRWRCSLLAMAIMTIIELFQLTMIPAGLAASPSLPLQIIGRLLGTQFAFQDLLAYAIGILAITFCDRA